VTDPDFAVVKTGLRQSMISQPSEQALNNTAAETNFGMRIA